MNQQINLCEILRQQNYAVSSYEVDPVYSLLKSASIYGDRIATRLEPEVDVNENRNRDVGVLAGWRVGHTQY